MIPLIVAVSFLLTAILGFKLSSDEPVFSQNYSPETKISDAYINMADKGPVKKYQPNVSIVSIDGASRREIAETIETVGFFEPAVVGLDVMFIPVSVDSTELAGAISSCEKIVLPKFMVPGSAAGIYEEDSQQSFFYPQLGDDCLFGAINMEGSDNYSLIRQFKPWYGMKDGEMPSFAVAVASAVSEDAVEKLRQRGKEDELIYYPQHEYDIINYDEIIENADLIKGRAVLIGAVDDELDKHMTPVKREMPGILIHAHILSTILNDEFIDLTPPWVNHLIAVFLSLLLVAFSILGKKLDYDNIVGRMIQVLLIALIVWQGTELLIRYGILLDFNESLSIIVASLFVCDIIYGSYGIILKKIKKNRSDI